MRPTRMRRSLLVAALVGVAVAPFPQGGAAASCAGPSLAVERSALARGTTLVVEGQSFVDGCQDSMGCTESFGCSSCSYDEPPPVPRTDVRLRLVQDGRSWPLGSADAGGPGTDQADEVRWRVTVPAEAEPGPARLVAEGASPLRVRLR